METTILALTNCTLEGARNGSRYNYTISNDYEYEMVLKDDARTYVAVGLALSWLWSVLIISLYLTVIVLICSYKKRSRLYFFLLNLAIADLSAGIIDAFPDAEERSIGLEYAVPLWMAGDAFCKIQRTIANTCIMTSNYILAVMSLDRTYAMCKQIMSIQKGSIQQKVIVISCWVFCFLCSSPYLIYYEARYYGKYFSFGDQQQCILYFGDTYEDIIHGHTAMLYLKFVFMFLIPLFIIVGSYTLLVVFIFRRALKQTPREKKVAKTGKERLNMSREFNKRVPKSKQKSIKLSLVIVLSKSNRSAFEDIIVKGFRNLLEKHIPLEIQEEQVQEKTRAVTATEKRKTKKLKLKTVTVSDCPKKITQNLEKAAEVLELTELETASGFHNRQAHDEDIEWESSLPALIGDSLSVLVQQEKAVPATFVKNYTKSILANEQQIQYLWTWVHPLNARTHTIENLMTNGQVMVNPHAPHDQTQPMLDSLTDNQQTGSSVPTIFQASQPEGSSSTCPNLESSSPNISSRTQSCEDVYSGFTKAQLICQIKVFGEYSKATKHLFRLQYKPEEYKGRCLTGCKANSKYAQRPALEDQGKLKMIYDIIREVYGMGDVFVKDKLREVLKPSRT